MKYRQRYPQLRDNWSARGARTIAERLLPASLLEPLRNAIDPPAADGCNRSSFSRTFLREIRLSDKHTSHSSAPLVLFIRLLSTFSFLFFSFFSCFDLSSPLIHLAVPMMLFTSATAQQRPLCGELHQLQQVHQCSRAQC